MILWSDTFLAKQCGASALEFDLEGDYLRQAVSGFEEHLRTRGWNLGVKSVLQFRAIHNSIISHAVLWTPILALANELRVPEILDVL